MRILILGGTIFLGRALVDAALARGHSLTLFNRGSSNPGLFPGVERLAGDRENDLSALHGRGWEAVIDTCGYLPRVVRASAELLAGAAEHYTFISSISVYADTNRPGVDESAAVGRLADESVETVDGETYGPLKALCEQAAQAAFPGRQAGRLARLLRPRPHRPGWTGRGAGGPAGRSAPVGAGQPGRPPGSVGRGLCYP